MSAAIRNTDQICTKHTFSQVNNKNKKLFIEGLIEEAGVTEAQRILHENDTGENLGDRIFVFCGQHYYLNSLESRFITVTTIRFMLRKRDESSNTMLPKFTLMLWNAV